MRMSHAGKFDCMGSSLVAMKQALMLEKYREECATRDIQLRLRGDMGKSSRFILLHTVAWTERGGTIPCEMGLVELSLEKGVLRYYNQLIDANPIPIGIKGAMKEYSDKYHHICEILAVREGEKYANKGVRLQAPSEIQDLVIEQDRCKAERKFKHLPIFVAKENLVQSKEAFEWLQNQAKTNFHFECYDLSVLFYHLMNFEVDASALRIPSLSIAKALLERDVLLYTSGMSCRFHEAEENSFCAGAICSRRAFIFLDMTCQALGVPKQESCHYPLGLPDSTKLEATAKLANSNKLANLTLEKLSLREVATSVSKGNIESHFLADFLDLEDVGDLTLCSELDLDSTTTASELDHSFTSQATLSVISRFSHRRKDTTRCTVEESSVEDFHSAVENMSVLSKDETVSRS
ncbi:protein maelstrom homolog isoform X2 [Tigriopus californicus]|uniref:protein maelstrom homolog isoform X2 n=1 Tax=Tigriopus californicus TaxID=6832 RepID=UPI0027DA7341|nr:protein maelstrom homolog isoform X2 [Tigriopus californicus]